MYTRNPEMGVYKPIHYRTGSISIEMRGAVRDTYSPKESRAKLMDEAISLTQVCRPNLIHGPYLGVTFPSAYEDMREAFEITGSILEEQSDIELKIKRIKPR